MTPLQLRKAERRQAKITIGLAGLSGSGKTYSALLLANGIADWSKIALIDSENGRGELHADSGEIGEYNYLRLTAPFTPEKYIEAIKTCEDAGMEVIIVDSITHEWEGAGGCLEINELTAQTKFKGNTWSAWSMTTPRHQKFINAIIFSSCHMITTARSKMETVYENGKVQKIGLKEIQREGYEYEVNVSFSLEREGNYAIVGKDDTRLFKGLPPFLITKETGKAILGWANSGKDAEPIEFEPVETKDPVSKPLLEKLIAKSGNDLGKVNFVCGLNLSKMENITNAQALECLQKLMQMKK